MVQMTGKHSFLYGHIQFLRHIKFMSRSVKRCCIPSPHRRPRDSLIFRMLRHTKKHYLRIYKHPESSQVESINHDMTSAITSSL